MPSPLETRLLEVVEQATGSGVVRMVVVRGGDVAAAYRFDLEGGKRIFAKTHPAPPAGFFTTEAASLAWLSAAETVAVPQVISVSDGTQESPACLLLEWLDEGRPSTSTERDFGAALARMHGAGAPSFGREDRRTTGSRALPNDPQLTWSAFYANCRLMPLARLAADGRSLPTTTIARLERLAASLDRFEDHEPPARLHGDLWAGNRLIDTLGQCWLIDPAAHGGHREFDLGMMRLFGGFSPACFRAYHEVHPFLAGWEERVSLHQIAPLVVHAIKFGGSYVQAAMAAIEKY